MSKIDLRIGIAIIFIGVSIIIGGYLIGDAVRTISVVNSPLASVSVENKVLNLSQIAKYLNMSEEEINGIIQIEKRTLEETGSFHGKMFPYFTINNKQYFYKDEIDEWLSEVASNNREYNTVNWWILH